MKKVMVVGGGTMGLNIAQVFARSGFQVVVREINDQLAQGSHDRLVKDLEKQVSKGKLDAAKKDELLSHMTFTTDIKMAADADLTVEAVLERVDLKKSVFKELDEVCKPETILATNTSSISITEIASGCKRQDKVIGMHFFNPPTVMKLVEVIRGANTSDATTAAVKAFAQELGKTPVEVHEAPGFVVNRILVPMINDAANVLREGVATAEDIDTAMKLGANHPMGPLALGDLIGLDICLAIMNVLYAETGDPHYHASPLLIKMVRAGKLGRKTGEGFFKY
ncbi:MAG TPA: 3-hydroxybutyryl-CoA dehydrogenase [Oscillospiraceae bacterium]|nr:3-hydroxybutyryl-CoA dehydrogenase [Oscillospiraceae bacterium]